MKRLFLASGSASRKKLLADAKIPFELISQNADESTISLDGTLEEAVTSLAKLKMENIVINDSFNHDDEVFVLTADTLTMTVDGEFLGKPKSREDAVRMLEVCRKSHARVGSGFCVDRRVFKNDSWTIEKRIVGFAEASCLFDVFDNDVDFYLDNIPFLTVSGGITIEGFGNQFLQDVQGSYSSIIGIPMFELRKALQEVGFL